MQTLRAKDYCHLLGFIGKQKVPSSLGPYNRVECSSTTAKQMVEVEDQLLIPFLHLDL